MIINPIKEIKQWGLKVYIKNQLLLIVMAIVGAYEWKITYKKTVHKNHRTSRKRNRFIDEDIEV